jgi:hypothetical protein
MVTKKPIDVMIGDTVYIYTQKKVTFADFIRISLTTDDSVGLAR